ncbi:glucose-methanol-choline oxidoreductase [Cavenderia fasciculata]|uniref:Glucose-methanol-choline oxidoreductase n=1 Tax=Cavenderia fasciculata TaxID=261658 RepID=F4PYY2_CACFS|nr:glucose-methanol-choline oxidoreductase [Cavenderia fasciculata]EGG19011.1 glucose-methanol-choline oxidoreductase [Cavenderia fasciculata]|eukprot:XP_004366644.1 glucose-methanol-choline oxidoreductase [Cavenderia fasciculata]
MKLLLLFIFLYFGYIQSDSIPSSSSSAASDQQQSKKDESIFGKISKTVEYDYIILGAGTSGSVVANKLSANKLNRVLLVEEGKYPQHPLIWEPNGWSDNWIFNYQPDYAKSFFSTPRSNTHNRSIELRRGVGLGGCGMINAMIFQVGVKEDYDLWVEHCGGDMEWDFDTSIKPLVDSELFNKAFNVRVNDKDRVFLPEMKQVLQDVGYTYGEEIDTRIGLFLDRRFAQSFDNRTGHWKRQTSYGQFVDNIIADRSNLDVYEGTKALKLDVEVDKKKAMVEAKGVYLLDKTTHRIIYAKVRKQIVISMGAYDSPLFLQFSGIGDWESLRRAGIKPVLHSPYVGASVSDQYSHIPPSAFLHDVAADGYVIYGPKPEDNNGSQKIKWILNPDIRPFMGGNRFICFVELVYPQSSGSIQIENATTTSFTVPLVDKNYLSSQQDINVIQDGLKACRMIESKLLERGYLQGDEFLPGFAVQSLEDLEKHIRATSLTDYHPHGSVRMGSDVTSPLSPRLKLKGSKNINVIDASVIPVTPSSNTNIPSVIIALKGSSFILQEDE